MFRFFKKLKKILLGEASAERCALSCAVGTFVGFSPYLGIQTILIIVLGWLMGLNIPIAFAVACIVNNPWTMIFIIVLDYVVGAWIMHYILPIDLSQYDPAFIRSFTVWLTHKIAPYVKSVSVLEKLSFWPYFIGGHIVALVAACIAYFVTKRLCKRLQGEHHQIMDRL